MKPKMKNMENQTSNKSKYLTKDLKRILIVSLIIAMVLAVLAIINLKTNFLLDLTELIMEKLIR